MSNKNRIQKVLKFANIFFGILIIIPGLIAIYSLYASFFPKYIEQTVIVTEKNSETHTHRSHGRSHKSTSYYIEWENVNGEEGLCYLKQSERNDISEGEMTTIYANQHSFQYLYDAVLNRNDYSWRISETSCHSQDLFSLFSASIIAAMSGCGLYSIRKKCKNITISQQ